MNPNPNPFVPLITFLGIAGLTWCWARVARKAGFSGGWGFVAMVPLLNIAALCVLAFAQWPAAPEESEDSRPPEP